MIYTLTFNPSLDYIVTVPKFTCGVVNRTTEEIIFPGGKGINVSMVLKNLGFENTALGFYAGFTGMELKRLVADKGIHAEFIPVDKGMTRINVKLRSEQESEINGQGPAIAASDIDKLYEKLDALKDGDILVMAGSIPDVMPQTMYMDIMKHLQGRNLKIVVDATRDLLVNVLPFHPFLIKPNNHELGEIFGVEICEKEDVVTLRNLGADDRLISRIFLFEGRLISLFGAISGIVLGLILCLIQQKFGIISLGGGGNFLVDAYPVSVHFWDVVLVFVTVFAVGFLSVWYPVRYLSKRLLSSGGK